MPTLQLQHIFSAIGVTRIGLQTGILHEPMGYVETPDIVKKRQVRFPMNLSAFLFLSVHTYETQT